ncbi:MAG: VOC family protein [candidate division Zixibacteria bacterium]|nr:VOC family protein [candidate division Zixibacteria bacterium]
MIAGGLATIFVTDFDRAVKFYSEILEMKLVFRSGDLWAEVSAGPGMTIGLHPISPNAAKPGTNGSTVVGLEVKQPIETVISELRARGVILSGELMNDDPVKIQNFLDPDGNELYLFEAKHD